MSYIEMGKKRDIIEGLKPTMMMVMVQIAATGVNLFYKLAALDGMNLKVLIAYRFIFAACTLLPIAFFIERETRPKMTWKILLQAFFCSFFGGSLAQNLYAESLVLSSATYAATMTNVIPAITFLLAVIFRLERLGLKTKAGKAKVVGTLTCMGGAMLLTFYKGCEIKIWSTTIDLMHESQLHVATAHHKSSTKVLGLLLALACCLFSSFSLVIQAKMSKTYPCPYSSTALISAMGSVQATVFALCTERDWKQWKLGWNIRLLSVAFMGVVASGILWTFIMSCVRMRGPLFVSIFNPLLLLLVALAGSLLLNEKLHLGSVLGGVLIISGLYSVLWGKSNETKKKGRLIPSPNATKAESIKGFNHGNINIITVAPNFVPDSEILEAFHEDDDEQDLEATTQIKT